MTRDSMPSMVFFDMDGVLAVYDWDMYLPDDNGVPPYMQEKRHSFRYCKPDPVAIGLLQRFMSMQVPSFILTAIRSDLPWVYHDKILWLERAIPEIDPSEQLIVASGDKAQAAMAAAKSRGLDRNMLLLDDFNQNLWDWHRAGGNAVKYLNGVNTRGTSGLAEFDSLAYRTEKY